MEIKRSGITFFQLFFLSFSYVFSGLFLVGARSFLPMLLPLCALILFSAAGFFFLEYAPRIFTEKGRLLSFLSMGKTHFPTKILAFFLILTAATEALLSVMAFSVSARRFATFLPFWLIFAIILFFVLFMASHGITAVGRFSELMAFLVLPLIFRLVFWDLQPILLGDFSENIYAFFLVTPAPIFYLLSMTVSESTAMPKAVDLRFFPIVCFFGGCAAVLCMLLFRLYGVGETNIFFLFFGWMASAVRVGTLFCVRI
jgi:hypothetical protein